MKLHILWGFLTTVGGVVTVRSDTRSLKQRANLFPYEKNHLTAQISETSSLYRERFGSRNKWYQSSEKKCKTYPDDHDWPTPSAWNQFSKDLGVDGALIRTVPEAAVCYNENGTLLSNSSACQALTDGWGNSTLRIENPTSIRSILFQGMTCMPPSLYGSFLNPSSNPTCTVGGYPAYVVNISSVAQIQLAVNFARDNNLRLVIKNTGHDFGAKSVGNGSLSIWVHYLKEMAFFADYSTPSYRGLAEHNITLVGGEGKTVGHIGGYIQGGGHSPLTSVLGMAADHILSMEIVTADGQFITADGNTNPDLFWAVSGGGGSTYGVVTSMIVKAYPRMKVTTMRYNMTTDANFSHEKFWAAQRVYVDNFERYADLGYYAYYRIRHVGDEIFHDATSWIAPNTSKLDFMASVEPMFKRWNEIGVPFNPIVQEYDNFADAWEGAFPQELWTVTMRQASRFFPRKNIANKTKRTEVMDALRGVFDEGANMIMFNMRNPPASFNIDNAVNPAWRDALMFAIMFVTWNVTDSPEYVTAKSRNLTFEWNPRWKALTPGGGTYMSESDYIEPDWQKSFHGSKYPRLYALKQKWDPLGVFYAQNAVGSEDWEMTELLMGHLPSQNSKLCRKH